MVSDDTMLVVSEEDCMFATFVNRVKQVMNTGLQVLRKQISAWTKLPTSALIVGSLRDLGGTKPQLIAENALLRQEFIVLSRSVKRPHLTNTDRSLLVLLASRVRVAGCCAACQAGHAAALASSGLSPVLHAEVTARIAHHGFPLTRSH
jgi:hypothetical protein